MSGPTPLPASPRTIDALALIALLIGAGQQALAIFTDYPVEGSVAAALLLVATATYLLRRSRGERVWSGWVFTVAAAGAWAFMATPFMLLPVVVGLLLLRLDHGHRAALLGAGLVLLIGAVVIMGIEGAGVGYVLREAVALGLVLYAVVWIAGSVADSYQAQRDRDEALAELERTHTALAASVETEKDLVLAQERTRAAGELHDGLGHRLTAIRLGLDYADRVFDDDPVAARAEVRTARDATLEALQEMRVWVRALSPGTHPEVGDAAAFEAIADTFRGTGLVVRVVTEGIDGLLSPEESLFAHRLIQEGLTNAVRHGRATEVDILVQRDVAELRISLRDNGSGADAVDEGFGLRSLRDRAAGLGGSVDAGSVDSGFALEAVLPRRVLTS
ncbi:MAG: histidine kinase [Actinomycetia bacterium]|nr:histidine kinase [Actinomycetes bacterium]